MVDPSDQILTVKPRINNSIYIILGTSLLVNICLIIALVITLLNNPSITKDINDRLLTTTSTIVNKDKELSPTVISTATPGVTTEQTQSPQIAGPAGDYSDDLGLKCNTSLIGTNQIDKLGLSFFLPKNWAVTDISPTRIVINPTDAFERIGPNYVALAVEREEREGLNNLTDYVSQRKNQLIPSTYTKDVTWGNMAAMIYDIDGSGEVVQQPSTNLLVMTNNYVYVFTRNYPYTNPIIEEKIAETILCTVKIND